MGGIRTFRDLIAWQKGKQLAKLVYRVTANARWGAVWTHESDASRRRFHSFQYCRGYARQSTADYLRFLRTSRGSIAELMTQYEIAAELSMIAPDPQLDSLLAEEDRILQGLIRSIETKTKQRKIPA